MPCLEPKLSSVSQGETLTWGKQGERTCKIPFRMARLEKYNCALHPEWLCAGKEASPPSRFLSLVTGIPGNVRGPWAVLQAEWSLAAGELAGLLPAALGPGVQPWERLAGAAQPGRHRAGALLPKLRAWICIPGPSRALLWVQDIVYFACKWGQVGIFAIGVSCNFRQPAFIVRDG